MNPDSPLNEAHLRDINASLEAIDRIQKQVDLAERAGIDVANQKKVLADKRDQLLKIKNVYFPNA